MRAVDYGKGCVGITSYRISPTPFTSILTSSIIYDLTLKLARDADSSRLLENSRGEIFNATIKVHLDLRQWDQEYRIYCNLGATVI